MLKVVDRGLRLSFTPIFSRERSHRFINFWLKGSRLIIVALLAWQLYQLMKRYSEHEVTTEYGMIMRPDINHFISFGTNDPEMNPYPDAIFCINLVNSIDDRYVEESLQNYRQDLERWRAKIAENDTAIARAIDIEIGQMDTRIRRGIAVGYLTQVYNPIEVHERMARKFQEQFLSCRIRSRVDKSGTGDGIKWDCHDHIKQNERLSYRSGGLHRTCHVLSFNPHDLPYYFRQASSHALVLELDLALKDWVLKLLLFIT